MEIHTKLNCGDVAFVLDGFDGILERTVGQVRVTVTNSNGDPDSMFDNYKPQSGREEKYMCEETGIGSGSIYTLGEHIFATREEALVGLEARREKHKEEIEQREKWKREQIESRKRQVFREMAELGIPFPSAHNEEPK